MRRVSRANTTENSSPVRKRNRGRKIKHRQPQKILPRNSETYRNVQHDFQHHNNDDGIYHAQPCRKRPCTQFRETWLQQVGENSTGAQPKQRDRNREKRKVVEEHDREQPRQRQFQQQSRKAGQRQPRQHSSFGYFGPERSWGSTRGNDSHKWIRGDSLAEATHCSDSLRLLLDMRTQPL